VVAFHTLNTGNRSIGNDKAEVVNLADYRESTQETEVRAAA